MPAATGMSGVSMAKTHDGPLGMTMIPIVNPTAAIAAAAANHFSCARCSPVERRNRKAISIAEATKMRTVARPVTLSSVSVIPGERAWRGCTIVGKLVRNSAVTPSAGTRKPSAPFATVSATRIRQPGDRGRPVGKICRSRKNTSVSPIEAWKSQAAHAAPGRPCAIAA